VVLDLNATDDGHLSGFANFHGGNLRPDGFPVGQKFSVITDDPRGGIVTDFIHLTIKFVHPQTAQVTGYIDGSRAQLSTGACLLLMPPGAAIVCSQLAITGL
jgi:hypothetical protein